MVEEPEKMDRVRELKKQDLSRPRWSGENEWSIVVLSFQ
jgi:hypothetical protein